MSTSISTHDAHLAAVINTLAGTHQRVQVTFRYPANTWNTTQTGRIVDVIGTGLRMKTRADVYYYHHVPLEQIVSIVSATKSRSKRDLAQYGEYRVYYRKAEVALNEEGELDVANTLRRLLAVA